MGTSVLSDSDGPPLPFGGVCPDTLIPPLLSPVATEIAFDPVPPCVRIVGL